MTAAADAAWPTQYVATSDFRKLHRVVDREQRRRRPSGTVHVERDVASGFDRVQEQQLRDDGVRHRVVDGLAEEDDPFPEQARVDVEGALAPRRLLDDGRHEPRFDPVHR
jgi:hypothetical protein